MKKTKGINHVAEGLREEYFFDYSKAKPNRFAGQPEEPRVVVVLDPDVAKVFETPDSVNEVLRALIKTMPERKRRGPNRRMKNARVGKR